MLVLLPASTLHVARCHGADLRRTGCGGRSDGGACCGTRSRPGLHCLPYAKLEKCVRAVYNGRRKCEKLQYIHAYVDVTPRALLQFTIHKTAIISIHQTKILGKALILTS